jgi:hypothetical protein
VLNVVQKVEQDQKGGIMRRFFTWAIAASLCVSMLSGPALATITLSYCYSDGVDGINGSGSYNISALATGVVVTLFCQKESNPPNQPIGQVQGGYYGGGQNWGLINNAPLVDQEPYTCWATVGYWLGGNPQLESSTPAWTGVIAG